MGSVSIRRATLNDVEDLLSLLDQQYRHHNDLNSQFYREPSLQLKQELRDFFDRIFKEETLGAFIAEVDEKIVGLATYAITDRGYPDTIPQRFLELIELIVDQAERSKGIGSQLFERIREEAKIHKVDKLKIIASTKNPGAMRFYEKNGGVAEEVTYFLDPEEV